VGLKVAILLFLSARALPHQDLPNRARLVVAIAAVGGGRMIIFVPTKVE